MQTEDPFEGISEGIDYPENNEKIASEEEWLRYFYENVGMNLSYSDFSALKNSFFIDTGKIAPIV